MRRQQEQKENEEKRNINNNDENNNINGNANANENSRFISNNNNNDVDDIDLNNNLNNNTIDINMNQFLQAQTQFLAAMTQTINNNNTIVNNLNNLNNINNNNANINNNNSNNNNINNSNPDKIAKSKLKYKINCTFAGKSYESIMEFERKIKRHVKRFGISSKDALDVILTDDKIITGNAKQILDNLLDSNDDITLQDVFKALKDTFGESKVKVIQNKIKNCNSNKYGTLAGYLGAIKALLSELELEQKAENERMQYDVYTLMNEAEKAQTIIKGLPLNARLKIIELINGDINGKMDVDTVTRKLQELNAIKEQLRLTSNPNELQMINTIFDWKDTKQISDSGYGNRQSNNYGGYGARERKTGYNKDKSEIVCKYFAAGYCKKGSQCDMKHEKQYKNTGNQNKGFKPKCKYGKYCKYKDTCNKYHGPTAQVNSIQDAYYNNNTYYDDEYYNDNTYNNNDPNDGTEQECPQQPNEQQ